MRTVIGLLAVCLPFMVMLGYVIVSGQKFVILDSISAYYYSCARNAFTGTLCMVGLFLMAYKGYNDRENITFNIAAGLAVLIALFPMNPCDQCCNFADNFGPVVSMVHRCWFNYIHFSCATALFIILGYASLFFFTISDKDEPGHKKTQRNFIYIVCGVIIWCALAFYGVYMIMDLKWPHAGFVEFLTNHHVLFFVETTCLESFGIAWLIKGEAIGLLND